MCQKFELIWQHHVKEPGLLKVDAKRAALKVACKGFPFPRNSVTVVRKTGRCGSPKCVLQWKAFYRLQGLQVAGSNEHDAGQGGELKGSKMYVVSARRLQ